MAYFQSDPSSSCLCSSSGQEYSSINPAGTSVVTEKSSSKQELVSSLFVALRLLLRDCMRVYTFIGIKEREDSSENPNASFDAKASEKTQETRQGPILCSRSQMQSLGIMANPVSIAIPADGNQVAMIISVGSVGDRPHGSGERNVRRRFLETIFSDSSSSARPRIPSQVRDFGEGTSRRQPVGENSQDRGLSSLAFSYDKDIPIFEDPENLAYVWRKI